MVTEQKIDDVPIFFQFTGGYMYTMYLRLTNFMLISNKGTSYPKLIHGWIRVPINSNVNLV